jgi:hypothetical protein
MQFREFGLYMNVIICDIFVFIESFKDLSTSIDDIIPYTSVVCGYGGKKGQI